MSQSDLGPGSSHEDDGRPILTGLTDSKGWITGLKDYVNSMKERCQYDIHPSEEWLANSFSMISLVHGRTVTAPPEQGSVAVTGQVSGDIVSRPLSSMQGRQVGLTSRKANPEHSSW